MGHVGSLSRRIRWPRVMGLGLGFALVAGASAPEPTVSSPREAFEVRRPALYQDMPSVEPTANGQPSRRWGLARGGMPCDDAAILRVSLRMELAARGVPGCGPTAGELGPPIRRVNNEPLNPGDEQIAWASATNQVIRFYQARVARDPKDPTQYRNLGAAYVQKARETGDVTYLGLAEQTLKRALALQPTDRVATTVTTRLAVVALSRHQFRDAIGYAERALAYETGQLVPYAILGDTYFEMGEYDKAAEAYAKMASTPGAAALSTRLAALRFLRGQVQDAIDETERGVEALLHDTAPRENVAWAEFRLGELHFGVGDLPKAEVAYGNAVRRYAGYHWALGGLAKVRAAQMRYQDAIRLYEQAMAVIPLPQYAAALGDVYTKLGRTREAAKAYALVEYIGALNAINKEIYNRDLALFYADHDLKVRHALELAERELTARRDVYTYDVVAWSYYKNQNPEGALSAMTEALKLGTKDARLFFHAGMIHDALGHRDEARDYLQRALATNPSFHVLQAELAQRTLKTLESGQSSP
jgi:tetratricopeptide (TPR) repeat protein